MWLIIYNTIKFKWATFGEYTTHKKIKHMDIFYSHVYNIYDAADGVYRFLANDRHHDTICTFIRISFRIFESEICSSTEVVVIINCPSKNLFKSIFSLFSPSLFAMGNAKIDGSLLQIKKII